MTHSKLVQSGRSTFKVEVNLRPGSKWAVMFYSISGRPPRVDGLREWTAVETKIAGYKKLATKRITTILIQDKEI